MKKDFELEFKKVVEEIKSNRNQFIFDYLDLVSSVIEGSFKDINYDKEDLYQIGVLGLIEAIDSFSISNKKRFNYYVATTIKKKINSFLKKHSSVDVINYNTINETIIDDNVNIEYECEKHESEECIREYVYNLPYVSSEVIKMYYGFYGKCYSFKEIALIFNVPEKKIKSLISKELITIRKLISSKKIDSKVKKISKIK